MPFKRKSSPYYYVKRWNLPGYGSTGYLSTRVKDKRIATQMEGLLDRLAERALVDPSWRVVLDAVCREHTITLPELLAARNQGRLDQLRRGLTDPPIGEAICRYREAAQPGRGARLGLRILGDLAPPGSRLSLITDPRRITRLCRQAERAGRKRNSVRRTLLRAISLLLRYHLGGAERNRIFSDVHFPGEDDTREVHLSPAEIGRLLQACTALGYGELALIVQVALVTSADRGVLLAGEHAGRTFRGLRVRDLRIYEEGGLYSGEAYLEDGKAEGRSRTVPLPDALCRQLLVQCQGRAPDDPVFGVRYAQLDYVWRRVRKEARLEHVRFKDLRAQTAIYAEETGVPQTAVQRTMGHSDEAMTRRYQARRAAMSQRQIEEMAAAMFGRTG